MVRLIYPPGVRALRRRERWLRIWRRAKILHLGETPFQVLRDPETVKGGEGLNIWGQPVGTLPEEMITPKE